MSGSLETVFPALHGLGRRALRACCLGVLAFAVARSPAAAERLAINFNPDWKFIRADVADASQPGCDDSAWANVSTPHTFNDTDTFDDWSLLGHRGETNQWEGRTWYRKSFVLPENFKGRKVFIEFEAARQVAEVYLNGHRLGISRNGFLPFGFDLTPYIRFDAPNVLSVMCDNRFMKDPVGEGRSPATARGADSNPNGLTLSEISARVNAAVPDDVERIEADQLPWNNPHWHPAHGGLYRNVRLYVTDPLHISLPLYSFLQTAGPYVYATDVTETSATIGLEVPVQNERSAAETVEVCAEVIDHEGKHTIDWKQEKSIAAGASALIKFSGTVQQPHFWEPGYPHLYRVVCSVRVAGREVDACEVSLGIRTARWDAQTGLRLNGNPLKLHGWGQKPTDEWPGLGAAQPDWMHAYTLNLMNEAGGNFVRWGHCAGPPASIAAADCLGIIIDQPGVDGESDTRGAAWVVRAAAFRDMIIYYRNHPSILIWEGGNQKVSREHARELSGYVAQYDPHGGRVYAHRRADRTTGEFMQVGIGTEGGRELAALPVVEGEYDREESPRRVWDDFSPPGFGYPEAKGQAYQLTSEQYAVNQVAQFFRKVGAPDHCGGANWIFSDSTSGGRVSCEVARASGEVDGVRLPKEAYYVCQAMFRSEPRVHIVGHWTYPAGTRKPVYVASNAEEVELFLNGKSLGRVIPTDRYLFTFTNVLWAAGEIKAVAFRNGVEVASTSKHTVGPAVSLRLTPITGEGGLRADGSDIVLIDVEAADARGERCPTFQQAVAFEIAGPGTWRGGYNSGKTNSINHTSLDLECGINRVALRATRVPGDITVHARSQGLAPATLTIKSCPVELEEGRWVKLPPGPKMILPAERKAQMAAGASSRSHVSLPREAVRSGRFARSFTYSGPATQVHLEQEVRDGLKVYLDRDYLFAQLPAEITGSDWVQAANADKLYSAADLMEIALPAGTTIYVAHDDRLARPGWLAAQFKPSGLGLAINGQRMTVFRHRAEREESLTMGGNAVDAGVKSCNMYLVFINASSGLAAGAPAPGGVAGN